MTGKAPTRSLGVARPPGSGAALAAMLLAAPIVILGLPAVVAAQQAAEFDSPTVNVRAPARSDSLSEQASDPSPAVAGVLSLATTAVPFAAGAMLGDEFGLGLVGASVLFGPLSGYAYGDVMERGVSGLVFRSAVAAGGTLAILALCQAGECNPFRDNPPRDEDLSAVTLGIVIVGGIVLVGSAAIDVLSAPDHVTRANEARAEAADRVEAEADSGLDLSVYPVLHAGPGPDEGRIGLAANLRF